MGGDPKKKFKDTKVGKFLLEKLPGFAGDVLPDRGVLGIVKNLIDSEPDMDPATRLELQKELAAIYKTEVEDRDSARQRQAKMAEAGDKDIMFNIAGIIGLAVFMFVVYAVVFITVPEQNRDLWIHMVGICEGIVISIFAYFFGAQAKKNRGPQSGL